MPKRTYWNRTLSKEVRLVYQRKPKVVKKYESKAYRRYCDYVRFHFGPDLIGKLFMEEFRMAPARLGFMRTFFAAQAGVTLPKVEHSAWYKAFSAAGPGDYKCKCAYATPEVWQRWQEPNQDLQPLKEN